MVKGLAKRVVVVKSPDKRLFEEAIFILKEDALRDSGISAQDIISEACRVAAGYVHGKRSRVMRIIACIAAAIAMAALGWALGELI